MLEVLRSASDYLDSLIGIRGVLGVRSVPWQWEVDIVWFGLV